MHTSFLIVVEWQLKDLASHEIAVKDFKRVRCACKNDESHRLAVHFQNLWANPGQKYKEGEFCFLNPHLLESSLFAWAAFLCHWLSALNYLHQVFLLIA